MLRAVIPAKAGIQCRAYAMDSRLRGNDGAVSAGINKLPLVGRGAMQECFLLSAKVCSAVVMQGCFALSVCAS